MKKIVLKFGLISGGIFVAMMVTTMPFMHQIGFDTGQIIGYTSLVVAFLFVFFGIRSYRETVGDGYITFGRAFKIGILITVIASFCYAFSWVIIYFNFAPDFLDKYTQYVIEKSRAAGAGPERSPRNSHKWSGSRVSSRILSTTFSSPSSWSPFPWGW